MKAIILDRDGVINFDSDEYIKHPDEWFAIPGSLQAIALLTKAGFKIFVATNQSGLARGFYTQETLNAIHQKLLNSVHVYGGKIEKIFCCIHHPNQKCQCRKPNTGLFEQIGQYLGHSLSGIPFIGDRYEDVLVAQKTKCKPILVRTGHGKETWEHHPELHEKVLVFDNLLKASHFLCQS